MKFNLQAFQTALGRDEILQNRAKTLGEGVYLANECATSLAFLLAQQKQQQLNDLLKAKILLYYNLL
jgi:hypothetical protein